MSQICVNLDGTCPLTVNGENVVFQQERAPEFASVFQSVLYLKKAELAQGKLLLPAQVPHPGACVPASWSHGKGDFIKPPRVTVGNSERGTRQ